MNNQIEELTIDANGPQRSGLATAALIASLIICCPVTTIIGPILGIISLVSMRGKPHVSGKGFAWTAIIVGVIATVIWAFAGMFIGKMAVQFIEKSGEVTTLTIQAGYDGDYETFRDGLARNAAEVSDEEIKTFIDELKTRYGKFDSASLNMEGDAGAQGASGPNTAATPIRFLFESTDVIGEVVFEVIPGEDFEINLYIHSFKIIDAKDGNILFPKGSPSVSTEQTSDVSATTDAPETTDTP
ncbi:MAG: DUF4190 domain-containing protein [Planctomycetes bacterium]|nr:DUF4190 domain-containing protein [Planctomycetota bacterium]